MKVKHPVDKIFDKELKDHRNLFIKLGIIGMILSVIIFLSY
ncbi:MAG: hypothetical protein SLAVMIC_00128 [uncultured marine phage]|uniref:Uncharacterized protein n=1 Tax=uncultured marine phage TaxID=707152 RepID=A0A8D9C8E5_9VIRU|nr:MAG: hypothetical protein SLAVMIC_00128 [uncultured marine phage]